jgi:hypothetical protein
LPKGVWLRVRVSGESVKVSRNQQPTLPSLCNQVAVFAGRGQRVSLGHFLLGNGEPVRLQVVGQKRKQRFLVSSRSWRLNQNAHQLQKMLLCRHIRHPRESKVTQSKERQRFSADALPALNQGETVYAVAAFAANASFAFSANAAKASGSLTANSANIFLLMVTPASFKP